MGHGSKIFLLSFHVSGLKWCKINSSQVLNSDHASHAYHHSLVLSLATSEMSRNQTCNHKEKNNAWITNCLLAFTEADGNGSNKSNEKRLTVSVNLIIDY